MTTLLGRYELGEKLGEGGMAEVYRGVQLTLDREVALKFIRPGMTDERFAARLAREARAVATLPEAQPDAETNPAFYAPLLAGITTLRGDAGCD